MPAKKKKDLYRATNIGELNREAEHSIVGVPNPRLYMKTSEQVFKKAEQFDLEGDEESAYIMYMRFFNIISTIKKTAEYNKNKKYFNDLMGTKNSMRAISQAEQLSESLKERYQEKEAEQVSKKLEARTIQQEKKKKKEEEEKDEEEKKKIEKALKDIDAKKEKDKAAKGKKEVSKSEADSKSEDTQNGLSRVCISVQELYAIITHSAESVLILDVRPQEQFSTSRINHANCINVPADIIPPGSTNTYIEKALPEASRSLWKQRASMDHIVMLDWWCDASSLAPSTTLASLKDALFKWDYYTHLKSEPVVLEGGYDEWLTFYPTLSTNANVPRPPRYDRSESDYSLDNINYDLDLDEAFIEESMSKPADKLDQLKQELENEPSGQQSGRPFIPTVDRSLKPKPAMNNQVTSIPPHRSRSYKGVDLDVIKNELKKELSQDKDTNNVNISQAASSSLNSLSSISNGSKSSNVPSSIPPAPSPKVNNVPGVNRALKPRLDTAEGSAQANAAHEAARKAREKAQEDLKEYKHEARRLIEERRARVAALEKEEKKLEAVKQMKKVELAETAEVLRAKKRIQQELAELEALKKKAEAEELDRQKEVERLKRDESEKLKWRQEADRLRALKKRPEQEQADVSQPEDSESSDNTVGKREESKERDRLELEEQEAEKRRIDMIEKERERREKQEREKQEREERAEEERAVEIKRLNKEKVDKERIERENRKAAQREAETGSSLPVGWQKMMDPITGQYKYMDPNKVLYQTPPGSPKRAATPGSPYNRRPTGRATPTNTPEHKGGVYKTKLKDDTETPRSGGMRRSHSSPNIAQLVDEPEPFTPLRVPLPSVDRGNKPRSPRPEFQMVPAKTEVSAAKVRNLQPTWGNVGKGLTGLRNLGNTCYMNSTIQCLSNTTFLTTYFLTDSYRNDIRRGGLLSKKGEVAEEFAVLIKALWTGQYRSINPRDFKSVMSKHYSVFSGYDQQDSQELLLCLLDSLHEDLNKIHNANKIKIPDQDKDNLPDEMAADKAWNIMKKLNDSIIIDLFQGQFMSTLTCLTCERKSVRFEPFMYLTVPIPSNSRCSLRDCILHFAKEEKMTGDSRWLCPSCKCNRDATKRIVIWRLPRILLIHLKRFYYQGMWRQKINAYVDFPLEGLDMTHYIQGPHKKMSSYSLYAVSNHFGTMEGGHYTAYCRSPSNSRWYKYDDHEVYEMSRSDIKSSAAYILYYSSIQQDLHFAS